MSKVEFRCSAAAKAECEFHDVCGADATYFKGSICQAFNEKIEKQATKQVKSGVTVQEWIPAKFPPKESGEYIVMIHKAANPTALLYSTEEKSWFEITIENEEEIYTYYPVDWWMAMPEPPKEKL